MPAAILHIAQGVGLSYQPTHRHVRTLEAMGVIATEKSGREVMCRLRASDELAVWLALLSVQERGELLKLPAPTGPLVAALRQAACHDPDAALEALAVRRTAENEIAQVLVISRARAVEQLGRRFAARTHAIAPVPVTCHTVGSWQETLAQMAERVLWVREAVALAHEQRFWTCTLQTDEAYVF
jgi:DNA-binding Lrp family transcriptional regulator